MLDGLTLKHWRWEPAEEEGYGFLVFDRAESGANTFSFEVLEELDQIVDRFKAEPPRGFAIISGKSSGFIAGADINQFRDFEDESQARSFIEKGHAVFDKLESLSCPTVAAIHGFCMGGGTEMALACRYRICTDDSKTKIGLPEVNLGIHPGWGGTARLPLLIGAPQAMNAILTGKPLPGKKALGVGLVQYVMPERHLRRAAIRVLKEKPQPRKAGFFARMTNNPLVRPFLAPQMEKQVAKKARKEHYPAPYAVIDLWKKHGNDKRAMLKGEIDSVTKLALTDTARNLVRVYFLQERLKSEGKSKQEPVKHVHVIGAGTMGGDIAAWCALRGLTVSLQDLEHDLVGKAVGRAHALFKKKLRKPRLVQAAMDRLTPDVDGHHVPQADLVLEAIVEDLDIKKKVFKGLEPRLKKGALLASNTSSIPLQDLAKGLKHPERLVGLHFFNPVAKMPLVEIVKHDKLEEAVAERGAAFIKSIGKLPVPVKSTPGFLVNRILMPYMLEAVTMYQEGVPGPVIDKAAEKFGMPMGPIELMDTVGLDVGGSVARILSDRLGFHVPDKFENLLAEGKRGKKDGEGFYKWKDGKAQKPKVDDNYTPPEDLTDRMILPYLNEAVAALRLKVVEDEELLDAGCIFGTGFAPFRGGPMAHIRATGKDELVQTLESLKEKHGDRFAADKGWQKL